MTTVEFNNKYSRYLEPGHYGMAIEDSKVINYLDLEFAKEIKKDPLFSFAQIKMKFGSSRCYTSSDNNAEWEASINKLIHDIKV